MKIWYWVFTSVFSCLPKSLYWTNSLSASRFGANNTRVVGFVPVQAILLRVGVFGPCVSVSTQNILWLRNWWASVLAMWTIFLTSSRIDLLLLKSPSSFFKLVAKYVNGMCLERAHLNPKSWFGFFSSGKAIFDICSSMSENKWCHFLWEFFLYDLRMACSVEVSSKITTV